MDGLFGMDFTLIPSRWNPARTSFQYHLPKMAALPNSAKADLSRGFTVAQVAQKHGWRLSMRTGGIFRTPRQWTLISN
jgi:hypothetical protein